MKRPLLILCLAAFTLGPAGTALAGPVPDGDFAGTGKDDPSVQIAFSIDDRAVEDLAIAGLTFECEDGNDFTGGVSASDARLRQDQTFSVLLRTGGVLARVKGAVKRNDNTATGTVEVSGRFDAGGQPDSNGRKCRTGLIRWRADRV